MTTREFFFKGNPITGRVFTVPVGRFVLSFSGLAIVMLLLAKAINIHSIPCGERNYGFWFKYFNWSVMYVFILPVIFGTMVVLSERIKASVLKLCGAPLHVITKKPGFDTPEYPELLSDRLSRAARPIFWIAFLLALLIWVADTQDMWRGFYLDRLNHGQFPATVQPDWDTAYTGFSFSKYQRYCGEMVSPCEQLNCSGYKPPSWKANLFFNVLPYTFQGIVVYLALFWVAKFYWFLHSFSDLMRFDDSPYQFNPLDNPEDPDTRLGLRPMGRIFNGFLLITLLFQAYILYNRVELISLASPGTSRLRVFRDLLLHPLNAGFHFDTLSLTEWILILFMGVPIIVICYFPLWTLYRYVLRRRYEAWEENARAFADAVQEGNNQLAEELKKKMGVLQKANVWPNGDSTARRFLIIMIVLAVAAILPPLLPFLLGVGIITEVVLAAWKRWQKRDAMRMSPSQTLQQIFIERVFSMDKHIDNKGVYVEGDHAHVHDINFSELWNQQNNSINLQSLSNELRTLREEMAREAMKPGTNQAHHFAEIAAVAAAEEEASSGKGAKALEYLSKAGQWTLEVASKIGVPIAIEAIKKSIGL